jgi:hypothetical protein
MNDNELITVLREQRGKVPMDTPVEQIIRRGRAVRARRRVPGVAAALGAAAAAAFAVSAALPVSHPASEPHAQLAAWTVARQADGSIKVTIRELRDPAGLQQRLRADGVPASVTALGQQDLSCRLYPMTQALFKSIYQAQNAAGSGNTILVIHPSALPSGAGVQIGAATGQQVGDHGLQQADGNQTVHQPIHQVAAGAQNVALRVGLVYASQQCTGS